MTVNFSRRSERTAARLSVLLALAFTVGAGCVYDEDERCGPNQHVDRFGRCACEPGFVDAEIGCTTCPQNELEQNGVCVCAEGYTRPQESAACELDAPGLGVSCVDDSECVTERFSHCQPDAAGSYCTSSGCASAEDCIGGFACDTASDPSYCKRPPTGQGATCASQDDCAGYEATYCETFEGKVCLVQGCTPEGDDCFSGWSCCDLTPFGFPTLCIPEGECPL